MAANAESMKKLRHDSATTGTGGKEMGGTYTKK
jgi:hypothetical protein